MDINAEDQGPIIYKPANDEDAGMVVESMIRIAKEHSCYVVCLFNGVPLEATPTRDFNRMLRHYHDAVDFSLAYKRAKRGSCRVVKGKRTS